MTDSETCLAGWCADDDWCALTCAASVLSNKWHPVIVHRLLDHGPLGFNRLHDRINGISSAVLSSSLETLGEHGIVDRAIVNEKPVRVEYSLTERGRDLEPVIDSLQEWGQTHLDRPARRNHIAGLRSP